MDNNENRTEKLRTIYESAEVFLYEITPKEIHNDMEKYFAVPEKKKTKAELLEVLLGSLQNRAMITNTIGLWNEKRTPVYKEIFLNYDNSAILNTYTEDTLFVCFKKHFDVDNVSFKSYAKSVLSACQYLNRFDNVEDFDKYVMSYDAITGELQKVLAKEIHGIGFALACDFLKDIGYTDYAKPDVHIKYIFRPFDLCKDEDFAVYQTVIEMANAVSETPFKVDRILWLIGSSKFYLHEDKVPIKLNNKDKFIEKVKVVL